MSSILEFPIDRISVRSRKPATAAADIIIFPGVRIERTQKQLAGLPAMGRKRRNAQVAVDQDIE